MTDIPQAGMKLKIENGNPECNREKIVS